MEISASKRTFLVGAIGEEKVAALEAKHTSLEAALDEAGLESKDLPEDAAEQMAAGAASAEKTTEVKDSAELTAVLQELVKGVKEAGDGMKALTEQVGVVSKDMESVKARLDELEKSDDQKVASALTPKVSGAPQGHRASESKGNIQTSEEAKKEEGPKSPIDEKIFQSLSQAAKVPVETT